MRVRRDALLDRLDPSDVKCSVCGGQWARRFPGEGTHVAVDQVVVARVVVDVDRDVAQLRHLAAQGVQQGVVLSLALVGFGGHGGGAGQDGFGGRKRREACAVEWDRAGR
jgi:hypothetical protein